MPTESAHVDQASQEAARGLAPPTPLPCCSLAPSVTTTLYSTNVSRALRRPLRAINSWIDLAHASVMYG
jgi:hypothetical protein